MLMMLSGLLLIALAAGLQNGLHLVQRQHREVAGKEQVKGEEDADGAQEHPNIHPRAPLYWLVEFLRARGEGISAGQAVITGSFAGVIEVPLNTDINFNYAGLGNMLVNFKAKG